MSLRLLVALSPPFLENDCLLTLCLFLNSGQDSCILDIRPAKCCIVHGSHHKHVCDWDLLANFERKSLNSDDFIIEHFQLLTVDSNHGEDLFRVSWDRDTSFWTVHINNCILALNRFLRCLSQCTSLLHQLLFLEWFLPLVCDFLILFIGTEGPSNTQAAFLVKVFEKGAHGSVLGLVQRLSTAISV